MRHEANSIGLPKQFIDSHVNHHQLMRTLGYDEPEFFRAYLAGEIPPGVALTEFIDVTFIVWPRGDIEHWFAMGRPVHAELANRRERVWLALRQSIETEHGCTLESLAAELVAASN